MVVVARRRPVPRPHGRDRCFGLSGHARAGVVGTVVGGYVAFPVIVLVFHVWIAGEGDVLWRAVWGGPFFAPLRYLGGSFAYRTKSCSMPVIELPSRGPTYPGIRPARSAAISRANRTKAVAAGV